MISSGYEMVLCCGGCYKLSKMMIMIIRFVIGSFVSRLSDVSKRSVTGIK